MMRRILPVLMMAVAWGVAPAMAQDDDRKAGHREHHGPEARMERLAEKLDLTDDQVAAVRPIFEEAHGEHRAVMERHHEAMRSEHDAIAERTEARLAEVLTAEQMAEFREMKATMKERMKKRHGDRGHAGGDDHE